MATKNKEENQAPVKVALAYTEERQAEIDQAKQSRVRVRYPASYQFKLEGYGVYIVPVGTAIEVPKEVANALAKQPLADGVEWAASTEGMPVQVPNSIVTPPSRVVDAVDTEK